MTDVILVRYGEIILKGLNRPVFEEKLMNNIKKSLTGLGKVNIIRSQARIYIEPIDSTYDFEDAVRRLVKVFGIVSVSRAWKIDSSIDDISKYSLELANLVYNQKKSFPKKTESNLSFKVDTKRGNKRFPMQSPEISANIGELILEDIPGLTVDVHNPDFIIYIEVRESTYIYSEIIKSNGGLPIGTNGKAVLLLSGGIDSPVAGWMMAKRGVEIEAVHFYSYPYTSERAKEKVITLTKILSTFCGKIRLHIIPFTEIQLSINEVCPADYTTIVMRRVMMMIAESVAEKIGAQALITGESMGQVASQTIQSLAVTNEVTNMPVFRPLIGMDKNEVIDTARKIDTFETSILPYEDCCTVFVAKHPKTKPKLDEVKKIEETLDLNMLIEKSIACQEIMEFTY